jgi:translocation and assembly module TamB
MRFGIAFLAVMLPISAVAQTSDRDYLTAFLEDSLSGAGRKVTVTGFTGALSSTASLTELTIADDQGIWLTLRDVSLDWSRSSLLSGAVVVNELTAKDIILDRLPVSEAAATAPEAGTFSLPELPVSIDIGKIAAEHISLGPTVLGQKIEARLDASMQLADGEGNAKLLLERSDAGPAGKIDLTVNYTNTGENLTIDLSAQEAAGGIAATKLGLPDAPSVSLTIKGAGPLNGFAADVALNTDGVDRLAGKVTTSGATDGATGFAADLAGDLAPLFLPAYAEFFGNQVALKVEGQRWPDGRMALSQMQVAAKALQLDGKLAMGADGLPQSFALTGKIADPFGRPVLLPLTTAQEVRIDGADLSLSYDAAMGEGWSADIAVTNFDRADFRASTLGLKGSGRIARVAGKPQIGGNLHFTAEGLEPTDRAVARALGAIIWGDVTGYWRQDSGLVSVSRFDLNGENYAAQASGKIEGLADAFAISGQAAAQMQDLARLSDLAGRDLSGAAALTVKGTGSPITGAFDLEATATGTDMSGGIPQLDALLRGQSRLSASVLRDTDGVTLRSLTVNAQTLTAEAQGKLASAGSDVTSTLNFSDLGSLGAGYHGALTGKAHLTGTLADAQMTLDAIGTDLAIGQDQADRLLSGQSVLALNLALKDGTLVVNRADISNPQLDAKATGLLATAGSDVSASLNFNDLRALGAGYRGALNGKVHLTGTMTEGAVTLEATGRDLAVGQAEADRLLAGQSTVALDLALKDGKLQVNRADISNPQLTAKASGTLDGAQQRLQIEARLANLALLVPQFPGVLTVSGSALQDADGLTLDLAGKGPGQIDATVKGRIAAGYGSADLAIKGSAQAALANVFLGTRSISGQTGFDLRLNGPLQPSSLSGPVTLTNGQLADPALKFSLRNISAKALLQSGRANIDASLDVSTGGKLAVQGSVDLAAPYTGDLTVDLQRVVLRDPDLYETRLNGQVTLKGPLTGGAMIAGRIALAEAEIRVPSTGFGGAAGLPDLKHVNEPANVHATRARAGLISTAKAEGGGASFGLDLVISAPERLFVRGRGLDAELGGELRLTGTTDNVVPVGSFSLIRGRLEILGKRLDLTNALLQMQGSLVPYLDVNATTTNDGITTGIEIIGTASDPEVRFTSSPELPEEEILAQLLFGQGLQNLSAFQALQLANAVAVLAGKGGDGLLSKLRKGAGLDNLDVKTATDGSTQVTAGKYISKKVYSEVTLDETGQTEINLNLDISKTIKLQAKTGSSGDTGLGIVLQKDY